MSARTEGAQAVRVTPADSWLARYWPGLLLCAAAGAIAWGAGWTEKRAIDNAVVDSLVIAIILGVLLRNALSLPAAVDAGARYSSKQVLEASVLLLGASVDVGQIVNAGLALFLLIVGSVVGSLTFAWVLGRAVGLSSKLAILVGVGNSICGNSAVAAVAPVIRASADDVAAAIGISALLGVGQILLLPLLVPGLDLTHYQYGVVAGIAVYAVPQVIAASFAVSNLSGQVATLVKLVRVLFLGPMILFLGLLHRRERAQEAATVSLRQRANTFMPWFVAGFLLLAAARSAGIISEDLGDLAKTASKLMFVVAMVGLGIGVDLKKIRAVGPRVAATILASMTFMIVVSVVGTFVLDLRS